MSDVKDVVTEDKTENEEGARPTSAKAESVKQTSRPSSAKPSSRPSSAKPSSRPQSAGNTSRPQSAASRGSRGSAKADKQEIEPVSEEPEIQHDLKDDTENNPDKQEPESGQPEEDLNHKESNSKNITEPAENQSENVDSLKRAPQEPPGNETEGTVENADNTQEAQIEQENNQEEKQAEATEGAEVEENKSKDEEKPDDDTKPEEDIKSDDGNKPKEEIEVDEKKTSEEGENVKDEEKEGHEGEKSEKTAPEETEEKVKDEKSAGAADESGEATKEVESEETQQAQAGDESKPNEDKETSEHGHQEESKEENQEEAVKGNQEEAREETQEEAVKDNQEEAKEENQEETVKENQEEVKEENQEEAVKDNQEEAKEENQEEAKNEGAEGDKPKSPPAKASTSLSRHQDQEDEFEENLPNIVMSTPMLPKEVIDLVLKPPKALLSTSNEDIQRAVDDHFLSIFNRDRASCYLDCMSGLSQTEVGMIPAVDAVDVGLIPPTLAYLRYVSSCYKEAEKRVTKMLNEYLEITITKQMKITKDLGANMPWFNQRKELTLSDNINDLERESANNSNTFKNSHNSIQSNSLNINELTIDNQPIFNTEEKQDEEEEETKKKIPTPPPPPQLEAEETFEEEEEEDDKTSAMSVHWCFGVNKNVKLLNLSTNKRKLIAYACGHSCVLYDVVNNKQRILQGHVNNISCTAISRDKRWLATADSGKQCMIIIWDTNTGIPVQTIFDAHPDGGVAALAITPDSRYIASLSHSHPQTLAIWDWTVESKQAVCTATLEQTYGLQTFLYFNPFDVNHIVSNSETQVIFYKWDSTEIVYFAPPLTNDDFRKPVGNYSQSIFLESSTRALTATSIGNLVVWDTNAPITKMTYKPTPNKKALKLIKLQEKGITVMTLCDGLFSYSKKFIVIGDQAGHVKFFDNNMKLMMWYSNFELGPYYLSHLHIHQILNDPEDERYKVFFGKEKEPAEPLGNFPPDATIAARKFKTRDFSISTYSGYMGMVEAEGSKLRVISKEAETDIRAIATHPKMPYIAAACDSGLLKVWDYETKKVVLSRQFKGSNPAIKCMAFHPKGHLIALGFATGYVRLIESSSLDDASADKLRLCKCQITKVAFALDGSYLACIDINYTTTVLKATHVQESPYKLIGRYRAHQKPVADIMFAEHPDKNEARLFTLGMDRRLVEYDLENSKRDDLKILSIDKIEQDARALCLTEYAPVTKERFFVTANDQFKFKLYNVTTKMCRKTILAPTFGSPVERMKLLPDSRFMTFMSSDKLGIHIVPLDGNPHKAMAVVAHPHGVHDFCYSMDGKYIFSCGGEDMIVHMWRVNYDACEAQLLLGGEHLDPFYGLIDGGREGQLFKELEDYFYYAQIRGEGINKMERRKITDTIPLSEIPYVMRAMGFFPTEQQIEDMVNELKYSMYVETGKYKERCSLEDFILLYVNHRPAFGVEANSLLNSFQKLEDENESIARRRLIDLLQKRGEHMTEMEIVECFVTLLGGAAEGARCEANPIDPDVGGDFMENYLPEEIDAHYFANDLLNLEFHDPNLMVEEIEDTEELKPIDKKQKQTTQVSFHE